MVEFSVAENAQCGTSVNIQMQAAVYNAGFNPGGSEIVNTTLGNNGSCNIASSCSPDSTNDINPTDGLWYNESRSGNGSDMYFNAANNLITFIQYTALPDRSPIWYITGAGSTQNNQSDFALTKLTYNGSLSAAYDSSNVTINEIGESLTTMIDSNNAIQTRTINGDFSAELIKAFAFGGNPAEQRTGLWYSQNQIFWGKSIATQGASQVNISYLYNNAGQPYWLIGSGANNVAESLNMDYFDTFCPNCPKVPFVATSAGTVKVDYDNSNTTANLESMQINLNGGNSDSQWNRTDLPLTILVPADND
jgi:hypothetical protein